MLEIKNGIKKYKKRIVLEDINLKFEDGKLYGISGTNGSGKTLILKALAGYIKLNSGVVLQDGKEIRGKENNYIQNAGIVIENTTMINEYTIEENLGFLKDITEINKEEIDLDKWYKFFGIEQFKENRFSELSLGTKQKVALIQALMHNPQNILLDEPFNGLDKKTVKKLKELIVEEKKKGKLIIIVTHSNDEFLKECDEIFEIENGVIQDDSEDEE